MTFIRRHKGREHAFQLGPMSTTTQVYLKAMYIDIHVNVTVIQQALLDLRFEVEFCVVSTYGTASSMRWFS